MHIPLHRMLAILLIAGSSTLLAGCNKEPESTADQNTDSIDSTVTAPSPDEMQARGLMLPQCKSAMRRGVEMGTVATDTATADEICECQVDTLIENNDMVEVTRYIEMEQNDQSTQEFAQMVSVSMNECATKYGVQLPS